MSFQALRRERDERQRLAKSYIKHNPSLDDEQASPMAIDENATPESNQGQTEAVRFDGLYNDLGPYPEIRTSKSKGRGLYSKCTLRKGATVFQTKPHVAVLSTVYLSEYCSNCFAPASAGQLKRCTKCQTVMYCTSTCQGSDWKLHKFECKTIRKWMESRPSESSTPPSEPVRCMARILWAMKEDKSDVVRKEIQNLVSHRQSLQPSSFEMHTNLAHSLVRYLGVTSPSDLEQYGLSAAGDLVDLISRFATNSFALTTPSLTPIGVVVSPLTALVNHSCDPNIAIVFPKAGSKSDEPLIKAIALREIKPKEEILVSYIDTTLPLSLRQKSLQETYNFKCDCPLCVTALGTETDLRESIWCSKRCGGSCKLPDEFEENSSSCIKCKSAVKKQTLNSARDLVRVGQAALEKANALEITNPPQALHVTRNMLALFSSSPLTPTSHPYLALSRLHLSLLIALLGASPENIDEAIRTSARCVSALMDLLAEGHPARGVGMAELGKLLAVDEPESITSDMATATTENSSSSFPPRGEARLRLAHETFLRAMKELEIGFGGGGGDVGADVQKLAREVDKELAVWTRGVKNARQG